MNKRFFLVLSTEEHELLFSAAAELGMSTSQYARDVLLPLSKRVLELSKHEGSIKTKRNFYMYLTKLDEGLDVEAT